MTMLIWMGHVMSHLRIEHSKITPEKSRCIVSNIWPNTYLAPHGFMLEVYVLHGLLLSSSPVVTVLSLYLLLM